jgi:hypothetical protein
MRDFDMKTTRMCFFRVVSTRYHYECLKDGVTVGGIDSDEHRRSATMYNNLG